MHYLLGCLYVKKNINKVLRKLVFRIARCLNIIFYERPLTNVFNKDFKRAVLISYITVPFRKPTLSHSNSYEVLAAARVFDDLGYIVDVISYNTLPKELEKYDVIYGFGDVFRAYFESGLNNKTTIYYATGFHVCHQNTSSLNRIRDVYNKKGVWIGKSARFVEKTWSHQTTLVDGIIALGNELCAESYKKYYDGKIFSLPAPFFCTLDGNKILSIRNNHSKQSYFWFGSSGLVHKGLDICLDFFRSRPDLTLHICGNIEHENQFEDVYRHELYELPNIHVHGFVKIDSAKFEHILKQCSFVIFPSCSEGGGVSVLTAIGNGALIPIITKESSISTGYEILIEEISIQGIARAVEYSESLELEQLLNLQYANLQYVLKEHNQTIYYERLKKIIEEIIVVVPQIS